MTLPNGPSIHDKIKKNYHIEVTWNISIEIDERVENISHMFNKWKDKKKLGQHWMYAWKLNWIAYKVQTTLKQFSRKTLLKSSEAVRWEFVVVWVENRTKDGFCDDYPKWFQ